MKKTKEKKEFIFLKKIKSSINNEKQYKIFESKQLIGLIILVIFSFLFIVSIVQVRGFSTINSYTIGMLFGYYSYFIYIAFIFLGLSCLFQIDLKIEKFIAKKFNRKFYFSWLPYLFLCLGCALVFESIFMSVKSKVIFPGIKAFYQFFNDWWTNFTNNKGTIKGSSPALPGIYNSGIIVSLFLSCIVSWSGYIVSIIIGLLFIIHFILYFMYGSLIKIARKKIFGDPNKKDNSIKDKEYKTKILDLSFEDNHGIIEKPKDNFLNNVEVKTTTISFDEPSNIFPIEDPFIENDNLSKNKSFIESKTQQINIEKNLTQEFDINKINKTQNSITNFETFNFELDIFKTETNDIEVKIDNGVNDKNKNKGV